MIGPGFTASGKLQHRYELSYPERCFLRRGLITPVINLLFVFDCPFEVSAPGARLNCACLIPTASPGRPGPTLRMEGGREKKINTQESVGLIIHLPGRQSAGVGTRLGWLRVGGWVASAGGRVGSVDPLDNRLTAVAKTAPHPSSLGRLTRSLYPRPEKTARCRRPRVIIEFGSFLIDTPGFTFFFFYFFSVGEKKNG